MCRMIGAIEVARFDAATIAGKWGNFCLHHWMINCPRALGTGIGQMLIRPGEDPSSLAVKLEVDDLVIVKRLP